MGVVAYTDVKKNKTCESETDLTDLNTSPVMHDRSYRLTSSATPYPQHVACLMSLRGCVCVRVRVRVFSLWLVRGIFPTCCISHLTLKLC